MITLSIDVTLLDKARFKKVTRRSGAEATYCDLVLFETENSEYGDYIVKQQISKEEREQNVQMPILGNGKKFERGSGAAARRNGPAPTPAAKEEGSDDVPF